MRSVNEILEYGSKLIRNNISEMLSSIELPDLRGLSWEYRKRGGKGLRGNLAILLCQAYGGEPLDAVPAATSIELDQDWLLVHDDIEDSSELRRDKPTLYRMVGTPIAINVGDYIGILAGMILGNGAKKWGAEKYLRISRLRHSVLKEVAEGQHMEMVMREHPLSKATPEFYLDLVDKKSASYTCGLPAGYGAIIAGLDDKKVSEVVKVVRRVGIPFQIQDDVLDLTAEPSPRDKWGKLFAGDIAEGKRTLAAIWTDQRAKGRDKKRHRELYGKSDITLSEKKEWVGIARKYGVIDDLKELANKLIHESLFEIDELLPDTITKKEILDLLNFFVTRKY